MHFIFLSSIRGNRAQYSGAKSYILGRIKITQFSNACIEMLSMTQIHPWINHTWTKMACIQFIKTRKTPHG